MLLLVIGDLHIPLRAHSIPAAFRESLLANGKINKILCTGNLCTKDELDSLKQYSPDIQTVRGEFDEDDLPDTDQIVESIAGFRVGVVPSCALIPPNDKERLAAKARELDVDVLAFGGGHHAVVFQHEGKLFVNPGSATGAFTPANPTPEPSFVIINFQGSSAVAYTYTLSDEAGMTVDKEKFSKVDES